jgi:hypothetical protein
MPRRISGSFAALATLAPLVMFAMSSDAGAVVTFTATDEIKTSVVGAQTFYDFDTVRNTSIGSFSGRWSSADTLSNPWNSSNAAFFGSNPISSNVDNKWFAVGTNDTTPETAALIFSNPVSYVGFRWGTTDTYNELKVYGTTGGLLTTILGAPQVSDLRPGKQKGDTFFNLFAGDEKISKLEFTSTFAFEADNFAVVVPLPAGFLLLLTAIGGLAMGSHFRRRAAT